MDECIPPVVRDSRWFMLPFFMLAYRRLDVSGIMQFKRRVWHMSDEEYDSFYSALNSISRRRQTDINEASLRRIEREIDAGTSNLLDVGCGRGYLVHYLRHRHPDVAFLATDIFSSHPELDGVSYRKAHAEDLPFESKSIDVVTCCHVIEHLKDPGAAVAELKRVAKKKLIVAVPQQRPYFFTLDEHIQFFQYAEQLTQLIGLTEFSCELIDGDWFYVGMVE
jgi:ubiquinone/menaquinone biosynthesis C-methylase UbiE